jgi:hypothetical protein
MFGYCHNDKCPFDLWAPNDYGHVENRAFSPYAKHEQEKEDVIQMILEAAANGSTDFSIELDDDFSDEDIKYIKEEVYRRMR